MPLFCIAAVEVLVVARRLRGWNGVALVAFTVQALLSVGVSFLSVRVPYEQWWGPITNPALETHYDNGHLVQNPTVFQ